MNDNVPDARCKVLAAAPGRAGVIAGSSACLFQAADSG